MQSRNNRPPRATLPNQGVHPINHKVIEWYTMECVRSKELPHWPRIAPILATLCQLTGVGSTYIPQDRRHHPTSFWKLHRVHSCQSGFRYRQRVCPYLIPDSLTTNHYYNTMVISKQFILQNQNIISFQKPYRYEIIILSKDIHFQIIAPLKL